MRSQYLQLWRAEFEAACKRRGVELPPNFEADGCMRELENGYGVMLSLDRRGFAPCGIIETTGQYFWRPSCRDMSGRIDPQQVIAAHGGPLPTRAYTVHESDPLKILGLELPPGKRTIAAKIIGLDVISLQRGEIAPRDLRLELQSSSGTFELNLDMMCSTFMPPGCSHLQPGECVALVLDIQDGGTAELRQILDRKKISEVRK